MAENEFDIPEPVRAQLVAMGIPREKHVPDVLAGLFPQEFHIAATGLSADDLARALIYLVRENIVSLPGAAGFISVKKVTPGWHFCQFYRDFGHLLDIVAPYIAEGLENGEACFWVLPDVVTTKAACDAVALSVGNVDPYFASGQLELRSHSTWYFDAQGRLKPFEEVAKALLIKQDRALARGFKFLRAAGDAGWVSGTEQSKKFIDYEMKINAGLQATKIAAVCTYRADVSADELIAIVTAHQDALYKAPAV